MSFADEITNYLDKYQLRFEDGIKILMYQLSNGIIMRTPVDTGRARANWFASIGAPVKTWQDKRSKTGTGPVKNVLKTVERLSPGDIFFLTNNLPYIRHLEYGLYPRNPKYGSPVKGRGRKSPRRYEIKTKNGFSKQAPSGMVRIEIRNFRRTLRKAIRQAMRNNP